MNRSLPLLALFLTTSLFAAEPQVTFERVASGLSDPVSITHAGDARLFITLQSGLVMIFDGTRLLTTPFLDVRNLVSNGNERGLLSIAFHPHYAENGFFYVNYTNTNGHTVVARYHVSSDPNRADANSAQQILFVEQPFENHNGGQLQFGPDGYLYIGMGDGGSGGDPGNRAQNKNELLGKLLRIDVDGAFPYAIPPSNPFANGGGRPEIWAYGLRNPWRFTFDRATGDLWIADVGQGSWEEVDVQRVTSIGGENYGWRTMEGTHCFNPSTNCNRTGLVLPVLEYNHAGGACSVTGGYVYRGTQSPRLQGTYIYGDFCNGRVWGATLDQQGLATISSFVDTTFNISTFGEDVNGEVYVADYSGGVIYRIVDSRPISAKRRATRH
jgi:glucose/arabinose dehydrogenase